MKQVLKLVIITQLALGVSMNVWASDCHQVLAPKTTGFRSIFHSWAKVETNSVEIAEAILSQWHKVSVADVANGTVNIENAFVRLSNTNELRGVYGRLMVIPVTENYQLIAVVDKLGEVHVFDSVSDVEIYDSQNAPRDNISFIELFNSTAIVTVDKNLFEQEVKNLSVTERSSIVSQYGFDPFEKANASYQLSRLRKAYDKVAKIATAATPAIIIFWCVSGALRAAGIGTHNYIHQHASNYYFGLVGLGLMQAGISSMNPKLRHVTLALALGTNLVANAVEEINFGSGRLNYFGGHQTATDWPDFFSGMLASMTYLAVYLTIETIVKRSKLKTEP